MGEPSDVELQQDRPEIAENRESVEVKEWDRAKLQGTSRRCGARVGSGGARPGQEREQMAKNDVWES